MTGRNNQRPRPRLFPRRPAGRVGSLILVLFLAACENTFVPIPSEPLDPDPVEEPAVVSSAVVDAEHGGLDGFYFLPPLVPDPDRAGPFDATLLNRVRVEICRVSGTSCAGGPLVTFTEAGAGGERLRVAAGSGQYHVNWHTGATGESPGMHRIRILADGMELGYADVDLVDRRRGGGGAASGLQLGRTLPIKFLIGEGVVAPLEIAVTEVPDVGPLLFALDVTVSTAADLTVEYWTDVGPRLRVRSVGTDAHHVLLPRLIADRTYEYEVLATAAGTPAELGRATGMFHSDTLPTDLAAVGRTVTGRSTAAMIMLELRVPTFQGFAAVDSDGRVVWYHRTGGSSWGWTRRANGNFVFLDTQTVLNEVTPAGAIVATLGNLSGGQVIHHDVIATPQNTIYFMTRSSQAVNGTTWVGEKIWEWTPETGTVVERWNAFDFLSPTSDVSGLSRTSDWLHGNSLNVGVSGNLLLSSPFLNQVIAITPDFSSLAWRLGGVNATIQTDAGAAFAFQHTAAEIAPGRVLVFDNRGAGTYSRALELAVDHTAGTATTAWEFRPPNDNYAAIISSARRMANGNTMVAFGPGPGLQGSAGPIEVYEVAPDGTVVWNLVVTGPQHMYRATPFETIAGEVAVSN